MPLVPLESEGPRERPPWRGALAGLVAGACFVVGLALAAWFTRDGSGPVRPPRPQTAFGTDAGSELPGPSGAEVATRSLGPDGGLDAALAAIGDAGSADAGPGAPVVTAAPEPDAGPVGATAPPVEVSALATVAEPLIQACLAEALRFDPSFGGRMTLRAELRGRTLQLLPPAGASPVFARCLEQRPARVEGEPRQANAALRVHLDGLRQSATVEDIELAE